MRAKGAQERPRQKKKEWARDTGYQDGKPHRSPAFNPKRLFVAGSEREKYGRKVSWDNADDAHYKERYSEACIGYRTDYRCHYNGQQETGRQYGDIKPMMGCPLAPFREQAAK